MRWHALDLKDFRMAADSKIFENIILLNYNIWRGLRQQFSSGKRSSDRLGRSVFELEELQQASEGSNGLFKLENKLAAISYID
jgi:hypothetical protein